MQGKHPICARADAAAARTTRVRTNIRDAYELLLPGMPSTWDTDGDAMHEAVDVFDDTGSDALEHYAGLFMARYTPPGGQFIGLLPGMQFEILGAMELRHIREQLAQIVELYMQLLEASNFFPTMNRSFLDYGISGGALNFNAEAQNFDSPFVFEAVPLPQLILEEGPNGRAETSFRFCKPRAANIPAMWPDAVIPDDLARIIEQGPSEQNQNNDRVALVEAMVARDDGMSDYVVIWRDKNVELVRRVVGRGARITFRNVLPAGQVYGRGPGLRHLRDLRQLNAIERMISEAGEQDLLTGQAYQAPQDHPDFANGGIVELYPGAVIPFATGGPMVGMPRNNSGALALNDREGLRARIETAFLKRQNPLLSGAVRSATEVAAAVEEELERFVPASTRLDSELLRPLTTRGLEIMQRLGLSPRIRFDGLRVQIKASGPLTERRRINAARSKLGWYQEVLASMGAEVVQITADSESLASQLLEDGGIPQQHLLEEEERQALRQQRLAAQQQGVQA